MEKEVFNKMRSTWGTTGINKISGNAISFGNIQNFLITWNKEQDGVTKIMMLDAKLAEFGFGPTPAFDKICANAKRDQYIGNLNQSDYLGVLLPDKNNLGNSGTVNQACGV